ncbi:hypothetical protein HYZ70_00925 [Candidatus Curtissbacteria bacterium]|nr:hypothetical protein [Candidatus Curtissbacteria bacterium]
MVKGTRKKHGFNVNLIAVVALAGFLGLVGLARARSEGKTLGLGTVLLADKGSGDGGSSGSGSSGSGSSGSSGSSGGSSGSSGSGSDSGSGSSGSGLSGSGSSGSGSSGSGSSSGSGTGSIDDNTRGECIGPDGVKFETEYEDCAKLNRSWGSSVNFTPAPIQPRLRQTVRPLPVLSPTEEEAEEVEDEDVDEVDEIEVEEEEIEDEDLVEVEGGRVRVRTEEERGREEVEVRISETERIRVRTKDGRTRIDVTTGGVKTRLEFRDDRVVVKAELEDGTEEELEDDTLFKIEQRLGDGGIKIATVAGERFVIQHGATGAVTQFPLTVDLATNTLRVTTPAGERDVALLPGSAVSGMLIAGIINQVGGLRVAELARTGELTDINRLVTLAERDGVAVYEIPGLSNQRLLGFIPVTIDRMAVVSAETGALVEIRESLLNRIFDILSF